MNQQQKSSPNNRQNHHLTITYNHHLTENQRKCAKSFPTKRIFWITQQFLRAFSNHQTPLARGPLTAPHPETTPP